MIEPTLDYEHAAYGRGIRYLIGCDEVGRGAVAGPVAVGAVLVALPVAKFPAGLRDSKLLTARMRKRLHLEIPGWVLSWSVGLADAEFIDSHGISKAMAAAAAQAVERVLAEHPVDLQRCEVILDGNTDYIGPKLQLPLKIATRVKADQEIATVAAASVMAKVERDSMMAELSEQFPEYGWAKNVGYGSHAHKQAVSEYGLSEQHRKTWIAHWVG